MGLLQQSLWLFFSLFQRYPLQRFDTIIERTKRNRDMEKREFFRKKMAMDEAINREEVVEMALTILLS